MPCTSLAVIPDLELTKRKQEQYEKIVSTPEKQVMKLKHIHRKHTHTERENIIVLASDTKLQCIKSFVEIMR